MQKKYWVRVSNARRDWYNKELMVTFFEGGKAMKKKLLALLMGVSLVMGLAACGSGSSDKGADTASTGEQKIYDQKCSGCHGGDLKGAMGPDLSKIGSTLSKDQILDTIKNGKGNMPPNVVTGDDANTIADWLAAKK